MSPQTQTADGTGRIRGDGPLNYDFAVFVAGADVHRQRTDAHEGEYAEVRFNGTQRAICLPAGGELHMPDGQIFPVAPYDWVVELPDGTMGSMSAETVADHMEFVSGPDAQRDAFDLTVQHVANGRKPVPEAPAAVLRDVPAMPHPDEASGIHARRQQEGSEFILNELQRQSEEAHARLQLLAGVAVKRDLISKSEAAEWVDTAVAPEGVVVSFNESLQSYEVVRQPSATAPSDGGATAVAEPAVDAEEPEPSGK